MTGCPAEMVISEVGDSWTIIRLNWEHNHELTLADETKFLKSHKNITEEEKTLIRTLNSINVPNRMIMVVLSYLRGGLSSVPYTKKDVSNFRTSIRKECGVNDMMQCFQFFAKRSSEDPLFFFKFQTDKDDRVRNLFWADGSGRRYYEIYGDCVSFDTTAKTNKYDLPFAPFVGVSGHGDNCLFAYALLQDETLETFEWLFKTFLEYMSNKAPKSIITDQDLAMKAAIKMVFPSTNHRNCLFHIVMNAENKTGRTFCLHTDIRDDFYDIIHNSLTMAEFTLLWKQFIVRCSLQNVRYFHLMWTTQKMWAPVYFKKEFYPFIQSTSRSEGTNSRYKLDVVSTQSVSTFLTHYARIAHTIHESQREQDSMTRNTTPTYLTEYSFEKQAAKFYNRKIFWKFQKTLKNSTRLLVTERVQNSVFEVFKSDFHAQNDF
ncbi:protein FAR1-RELATED SEQUENCE 5-like [Oryza brachyantha]|uniref:protein FAR1-RELATED SEQUENCE 5-like n=1 Tax=Oryza brachyantha TaxID=4533 RepID=UPI0007764A83|nr:protein FAR1-RELATED SEQUENCE 5-like [Oryza brachyantha]XP_040384995.1 protein FAR1-RELATED SEQUENCE 5-like [Oryza brachyantha]